MRFINRLLCLLPIERHRDAVLLLVEGLKQRRIDELGHKFEKPLQVHRLRKK